MHQLVKLPKPLLESHANDPNPPKNGTKNITYGFFIIFISNNLLILLGDKYQRRKYLPEIRKMSLEPIIVFTVLTAG